MRFKDIRDFAAFLESRGELRRVRAPVSRDLEITEITDRVIKSGGPALLFENVEGYEAPLLINMFGTHQRTAWALGVEHVDDLVARVRRLLSLTQGPPTGLGARLGALGDVLGVARARPKLVRRAPCQEIVLTGEDVDLNVMPALKCWPLDAGRFITLPLVITRDPDSGRRNVGIYRMQIYDKRTAGLHWQTHKVGAAHHDAGVRGGLERLEVAVAVGGDPATIWAGSMPLPPDLDELAIAGVIRGEAVQVVKCKTVDLEVPANAEYVIEGYVTPGELRPEGPFGDHTGYYSPAEDYPFMRVTAITHRRDPVYPTTMVGRPPTEDFFMGKASERLMLPALQMAVPEIVDMNMPAGGHLQELRDCVDEEALPRPRAEGDARPVGHRAAHAGKGHRDRGRLRERAGPVRSGLARRGEHRPRARHHAVRGPDGRPRPRLPPCPATAAKSASTPRPRGQSTASPASGRRTS